MATGSRKFRESPGRDLLCAAFIAKVYRWGLLVHPIRLQFGLPPGQGLLLLRGKTGAGGGKEFIRWTMDADRHVRHLHTVAGHLASALADVAKSEEYRRNPQIKANLRVHGKFLEIAVGPEGEWVGVP
jgi:hypothetical protein